MSFDTPRIWRATPSGSTIARFTVCSQRTCPAASVIDSSAMIFSRRLSRTSRSSCRKCSTSSALALKSASRMPTRRFDRGAVGLGDGAVHQGEATVAILGEDEVGTDVEDLAQEVAVRLARPRDLGLQRRAAPAQAFEFVASPGSSAAATSAAPQARRRSRRASRRRSGGFRLSTKPAARPRHRAPPCRRTPPARASRSSRPAAAAGAPSAPDRRRQRR